MFSVAIGACVCRRDEAVGAGTGAGALPALGREGAEGPGAAGGQRCSCPPARTPASGFFLGQKRCFASPFTNSLCVSAASSPEPKLMSEKPSCTKSDFFAPVQKWTHF